MTHTPKHYLISEFKWHPKYHLLIKVDLDAVDMAGFCIVGRRETLYFERYKPSPMIIPKIVRDLLYTGLVRTYAHVNEQRREIDYYAAIINQQTHP